MKTLRHSAIAMTCAVLFSACAPSLTDEQIIYLSQDIVKMLQETYTPNPRIEPVRLEDFPLLDHAYYQDKTTEFQSAGYRWVGDLEIKHISQRDAAFKTCIRAFISPDQTISAAVWQLHKSPQLAKEVRFLECETRFSDGHWVATQNKTIKKMNPDPERVTLRLLDTENVSELLAEHAKGVERYTASRAVTIQPVRGLQDVIQAQIQQAIDEAAYRKRIGGVTDAELNALNPGLSKKDIQSLLEKIHQAYR